MELIAPEQKDFGIEQQSQKRYTKALTVKPLKNGIGAPHYIVPKLWRSKAKDAVRAQRAKRNLVPNRLGILNLPRKRCFENYAVPDKAHFHRASRCIAEPLRIRPHGLNTASTIAMSRAVGETIGGKIRLPTASEVASPPLGMVQ
jgi:hypothetical protein